jgi:long-subunit fatty acid transport protein
MYLRSRFEVSYNIKKLPVNPYFSAEMHYQLNNPYGNDIDKWRYTAGMKYNINKRFAIDLFYRVDDEVNVKNPVHTSVIGTMVKYQF